MSYDLTVTVSVPPEPNPVPDLEVGMLVYRKSWNELLIITESHPNYAKGFVLQPDSKFGDMRSLRITSDLEPFEGSVTLTQEKTK